MSEGEYVSKEEYDKLKKKVEELEAKCTPIFEERSEEKAEEAETEEIEEVSSEQEETTEEA